jgi:hypothetical protein
MQHASAHPLLRVSHNGRPAQQSTDLVQLLELLLVCMPHIPELGQLTPDLILILVSVRAAVKPGGGCRGIRQDTQVV